MANDIYIQVEFQSAEADAQIKKLNAEIAGISKVTDATTKQSTQAFKGFSVAIQETEKSVFGLGQAIAALGLVRLGAEMVQTADKLNRVQIAFEGLLGSGQMAADMMTTLQGIAAKSPFAFEDIAEGAQRLKAFGLQAAKIPAAISAIAAAAAAMGGSKEKIDSITLAIGQMYTKGEAQSAQLFRGLASQGVQIFPILRAALQKETGQVLDDQSIRKLIEKGQLAGKAAADALLSGMQERFGAASDKMTSLVSVQFTKLTDEIQRLARVIEADLTPTLSKWIQHTQDLVKWLEQLPPPLRAIIEDVGEFVTVLTALSLAFKALSGIAGTLGITSALTSLSAAMEATTVAGGTMVEGFGTWAMAAVPASISIAGIATSIGYVALAIGGVVATNKLVDWLENIRAKIVDINNLPISPELKLLFELMTHEANKARIATDELQHYAIAAQKRNQELRAQAMKIAPFETKELPELPATATKEGVDALAAQNRMLMLIIADSMAEAKEKMIQADRALLEHLDDITMAALERSRAKVVGGVAAVKYEMADLYREIDKAEHPFNRVLATPAEDRARVAEAGRNKIKAIEDEYAKKSAADQRELNQKLAQDRIEDMKKAGELEVALAKETSSETLQARAQAQAAGYDALVANEKKITAATLAEIEVRKQQDIQARVGELAEQGASFMARMNLKHQIETTYQIQSEKEQQASIERMAKYRLDVERGVIQETQQLNQQAFEMHNQNQLDRAAHMGELLKLQVEAVPAQTEEDKTAQAKAAAQAQIDALNIMYAAQVKLDQDLYASRDESLRILWANGLIKAKAYYDEIASMDRLQIETRAKLDQDRIFETQKLEIEAIKKHNEAVIADQKEVYDQIKTGVDKVWDAMTSRSETFAKRLGDMLKTTFMEAAKSIVTTHVSAALTEMFGKGHVGFGGGPLRQLLGKEPIFGADKIQLPGHLGDVTTIDVGGYKAVPIVDVGPQRPGGDVTNNIHVTAPPTAPPVAAGVMAAAAATARSWAPWSGGSNPFVTSQFSVGSGNGEFVSAADLASGGGGGGAGTSGGWLSNPFSQVASLFGYGGGAGGAGAAAGAGGGGDLGGSAGMFGGGAQVPGFSAFSQMASLASPGGFSPLGAAATITKLSALGNLAKMFGIAGRGGGTGVDLATGAAATLPGGLSFNLAPGSMLPGLGLGASIAGLMGARQLGTHGTGGLIGGAALGAFSGLLAAGSLAALFPSIFVPLLAAGPVGWIIAGGIGATIGLSSLFIKTADEKVRQKVKQVYGVDISEKNIRMQIAQIAKDRYGGNLDVAIASPEVQQIVRMYSIATGKNPSGLPRPMYAATFTQSGAGGVNLQPVYSGGNVVANPYSGVTTTQYAQLGQQLTYLSLDPTQALSLLSGQVTGVMAQNPGNVAAANAAALASGNSRDAQNNALFEPLTVMS